MMMKPKNKNLQKIKVFYDGKCIVCVKEIDFYSRRDKENKIEFIDISLPSFDPVSEGIDPNQVQKVFHVKDLNNSLVTGVDAFIKIWEVLDIFKPLAKAADSSLGRPFFNFGYKAFTKIRPFLPRKKCSDGACEI